MFSDDETVAFANWVIFSKRTLVIDDNETNKQGTDNNQGSLLVFHH